MTEEVKKLVESVETNKFCKGRTDKGIFLDDDYVLKSDFDRVVNELTKWNNEKLYEVETYAGSYEDSVTLFEGLYTDAIDAEKMRDAIEAEYQALACEIIPEWTEDSLITDDEFEKYMTKISFQNILKQGFTVMVIERELNTIRKPIN